jgi:hypothetical protein
MRPIFTHRQGEDRDAAWTRMCSQPSRSPSPLDRLIRSILFVSQQSQVTSVLRAPAVLDFWIINSPSKESKTNRRADT